MSRRIPILCVVGIGPPPFPKRLSTRTVVSFLYVIGFIPNGDLFFDGGLSFIEGTTIFTTAWRTNRVCSESLYDTCGGG